MLFKLKSFFVILCISGCALSLPETGEAKSSYKRTVNSFVRMMVKKHKFKSSHVRSILRRAKKKKSILEAITRPAESKPWYQYQGYFINDKRIDKGVVFWNKYKNTLLKAENTYGVPAHIIAGIIGVETRFGTHKGGYRVLDALYTLGFHYPRRGRFFRTELAHFLVMTREEKLNPLYVKGSYAGALGWPQFMPSSFRRYAVDFNNDGRRDLIRSVPDAIGSVANYLAKKGWQKDGIIALPAEISGNKHKQFLSKSIRPRSTISSLSSFGITTKSTVDPNEQAALFELEIENGHEYWLGFNNFYVITRYNPSKLYAMAVMKLGNAVKKRVIMKEKENSVSEKTQS